MSKQQQQQQQQQQQRPHNGDKLNNSHCLSPLQSETNTISSSSNNNNCAMMGVQFINQDNQHQITTTTTTTTNKNKNKNKNKKCPKNNHRKTSSNNKRRGGKGGGGKGGGGGKIKGKRRGGQGGGGGGGRHNWQLPESSIDDYMKWIQEKPEKDQTPNEQRFLWKYMIRRLGVVNDNNNNNGTGCGGGGGRRRNRKEHIREFVEQLQVKPAQERSNQEKQFIRLYYLRKKNRKAQRIQQQQEPSLSALEHHDETTVSWMRVSINDTSNNSNDDINHNHNTNNNKGLEPMAGLASLRESMMKLGLSSDKLKQVRFVDE
jgi:hypothetical protein